MILKSDDLQRILWLLTIRVESVAFGTSSYSVCVLMQIKHLWSAWWTISQFFMTAPIARARDMFSHAGTHSISEVLAMGLGTTHTITVTDK